MSKSIQDAAEDLVDEILRNRHRAPRVKAAMLTIRGQRLIALDELVSSLEMDADKAPPGMREYMVEVARQLRGIVAGAAAATKIQRREEAKS